MLTLSRVLQEAFQVEQMLLQKALFKLCETHSLYLDQISRAVGLNLRVKFVDLAFKQSDHLICVLFVV